MIIVGTRPVAWMSRQGIEELSACNGVSVWCESADMYDWAPSEAPKHLVPVFSLAGMEAFREQRDELAAKLDAQHAAELKRWQARWSQLPADVQDACADAEDPLSAGIAELKRRLAVEFQQNEAREAALKAAEPVAYLHTVRVVSPHANPNEIDLALSFSPNVFPLGATGMFESVGVLPLVFGDAGG